MKKKNLCALIVLVIMITSMVLSSTALAVETPLAELYFYDHPDASLGEALKTDTYKSVTEAELDSAGYNCYSYVNVPAGPASSSSVLRTLDDDAVFIIIAHGANGRMVCVDNSNNCTRLSASINNSDNIAYSLEANIENKGLDLENMKFAYFMGCYTYGTSSSYGSLNSKAEELGVDCVITHSEQIWLPYAARFAYLLTYYGDQGYTVAKCLTKAKAYLLSENEGSIYMDCIDETINNYVVTGEIGSSVKFEPASYGS